MDSWPQYSSLIGPDDEYCGEVACDWWPAILSCDWLLQGGLLSLVWTVVMVRLQCCGVTGHEDFRHSPAWTRDTRHTQQVGGDIHLHYTVQNMSQLVPQLDPSVKLYNHGEGPY